MILLPLPLIRTMLGSTRPMLMRVTVTPGLQRTFIKEFTLLMFQRMTLLLQSDVETNQLLFYKHKNKFINFNCFKIFHFLKTPDILVFGFKQIEFPYLVVFSLWLEIKSKYYYTLHPQLLPELALLDILILSLLEWFIEE